MFFRDGSFIFAAIEALSYVFIVFIIYNRRINVETRKFAIMIILYTFSVLLLVVTANTGAGMVCILALLFLSGVLLESNKLLYLVLFNIVIFTLLTFLLFFGTFDGTIMEAYKSIWIINMLTTQVCGIGLLSLTHIIYKALEG